MKGRGARIICGRQLREYDISRLSRQSSRHSFVHEFQRDKIRFVLQSKPRHLRNERLFPHGEKSPFPTRLIIGQISISGRHLFPIPESGRPMEPVRPVPLAFVPPR